MPPITSMVRPRGNALRVLSAAKPLRAAFGQIAIGTPVRWVSAGWSAVAGRGPRGGSLSAFCKIPKETATIVEIFLRKISTWRLAISSPPVPRDVRDGRWSRVGVVKVRTGARAGRGAWLDSSGRKLGPQAGASSGAGVLGWSRDRTERRALLRGEAYLAVPPFGGCRVGAHPRLLTAPWYRERYRQRPRATQRCAPRR